MIYTFRNLYHKTQFRVKWSGKSSAPLLNNIGVNQGGVIIGLFFFSKYLSSFSDLSKQLGVMMSDDILAKFCVMTISPYWTMYFFNICLFCNKPRKAIFGLQKKVKFSKILPFLLIIARYCTIDKNASHELDAMFLDDVCCALCTNNNDVMSLYLAQNGNFPKAYIAIPIFVGVLLLAYYTYKQGELSNLCSICCVRRINRVSIHWF